MFFNGLDAFRAIAAILVIAGHVELIKQSLNLPNKYDSMPFYMAQGDLAVTFFFVLSGFLITYLLLLEKDRNGIISLRKFYMRRIFRIWPLYFLITVLGFAYFSCTNSVDNKFYLSLLFHALVLPNLSPESNPLAFQSWSIGVEEQFYIIWPLLFFMRKAKIIYFIVAICFVHYALRCFAVVMLDQNYFIDFVKLKHFSDNARFDNMAIGGGLAYLMYCHGFSVDKKFHLAIYVITLCMLISKVSFGYGLGHAIYSFIFALNIYCIVTTVKADSFFETGLLKYFGKISYGIYMWHVISIRIVIDLTKNLINYDSDLGNCLLHVMCLCLTLVMASISYHFYESYFLKLKYKLAKSI